jgi:TonB family protein
MKFRIAVTVSVIFHLSLFAIALYVPTSGGSGETVYRVDLIQLPGGGGGGGKAAKTGGQLIDEPQRLKDLTVQKKESSTRLRYKDETKKKRPSRKKKKTKKQDIISVVKKKPKKNRDAVSVTRKRNLGRNVLTTGISAGGGGGSGGGSGGGFGAGSGSGSGIGNFPYAYYIEALRSKISSSWYSAVVSPGQRGKHVAVVYFKIMRNGGIQGLELKQRSGIQTLDLSSVRAIENAAPFPPLPRDYPDRYLGVYFEFEWNK